MAKKKVKKIQIFIDPLGNSMNIWWDNPAHAHHSEEAAKSFDIVVFDKQDHPIGFEKLGVFPQEIDPMRRLMPPSKSMLVAR